MSTEKDRITYQPEPQENGDELFGLSLMGAAALCFISGVGYLNRDMGEYAQQHDVPLDIVTRAEYFLQNQQTFLVSMGVLLFTIGAGLLGKTILKEGLASDNNPQR